MKNILLLFLLFCTAIYSQLTYTKTSIGSWDDPNGWENGMVPPNPIEQNSIVNIAHRTFINSDITNFGEINFIGDTSQFVAITSPVTITNNGEINNESFFEIRNNGAGVINNGTFINNNYIRNHGTITLGADGIFENTNNSSFYNWGLTFPNGIPVCAESLKGTINNLEGGVFCNNAGFNQSNNGSQLGFGLHCFDGGNYNDGMTNMAVNIPTCPILGTPDFTHNLSDLIMIVPNPIKNTLKIETQLSLKSVHVYSVIGELVISNTNFKLEIDASKLSPGMYFAQIKTGNSRVTKKFIKY